MLGVLAGAAGGPLAGGSLRRFVTRWRRSGRPSFWVREPGTASSSNRGRW